MKSVLLAVFLFTSILPSTALADSPAATLRESARRKRHAGAWLLVVGIALHTVSNFVLADAVIKDVGTWCEDGECPTKRRYPDGDRRIVGSSVAMGVGVAVIVAGAAALGLSRVDRKRADQLDLQIAPTASAGYGGVSIAGRF